MWLGPDLAFHHYDQNHNAIVRVRGNPPNGIFGPCACLLAGGCGAWRLLARRRRRRRRHSSILQVDIQTKVRKIQELLENSDFGKSVGQLRHVFLERISMRV